ncbi:hypothetical protein SAMN04488121_103922 [Chitinophaga filiformis]|uniref:Uncharacterized protein n=1 Tax=Chitinophaga filiformis TaxID=104663 RepID=A0A1G7SLI1_CHIFI|nr:hypothetical protein SAMN04488121_103922 [Chitinophaga filiformis]
MTHVFAVETGHYQPFKNLRKKQKNSFLSPLKKKQSRCLIVNVSMSAWVIIGEKKLKNSFSRSFPPFFNFPDSRSMQLPSFIFVLTTVYELMPVLVTFKIVDA